MILTDKNFIDLAVLNDAANYLYGKSQINSEQHYKINVLLRSTETKATEIYF